MQPSAPLCGCGESGDGKWVRSHEYLLPYETIVKAQQGEPEAVNAVLARYAGYIRYFSKMNGYYNSDMEDYIQSKTD